MTVTAPDRRSRDSASRAPRPTGKGEGDGAEGGQGEVRDDGGAAVRELDADHVAGADAQAAQAAGETSDLAVQGGVAELAPGVEDGGAVGVGDPPGPEEAVEVEVGAGAVGRPGAAESGGQQVAQGDGHARLQGRGRRGRRVRRGGSGA